VTDLLAVPPDATPLTSQESRGLRLPVLTRAELNQAEAENISEAMLWLFHSRRRLRPETVIKEEWLAGLHKLMYGQVWTWAGKYRSSDRNLGVPYWQVRIDMRTLAADAGQWLASLDGARSGRDELAIRFGHRLVAIHPFPNGNGRWSRMASDALIVAMGGQRFTWGGGSLTEATQNRRRYITALQTADRAGGFGPLLEFARS
jgi:Fic-DOC domain mobile mystery protein B